MLKIQISNLNAKIFFWPSSRPHHQLRLETLLKLFCREAALDTSHQRETSSRRRRRVRGHEMILKQTTKDEKML